MFFFRFFLRRSLSCHRSATTYKRLCSRTNYCSRLPPPLPPYTYFPPCSYSSLPSPSLLTPSSPMLLPFLLTASTDGCGRWPAPQTEQATTKPPTPLPFLLLHLSLLLPPARRTRTAADGHARRRMGAGGCEAAPSPSSSSSLTAAPAGCGRPRAHRRIGAGGNQSRPLPAPPRPSLP